jgi:hypothetical protein
MNEDIAGLMGDVASRLLGEPNKRLSKKGKELRYGTKGSLAVDLAKGTFFDHETETGGGVLELVRKRTGNDPIQWLRDQGLLQANHIVATFDYRDEAGELLFQVCRTTEKRFYQRRPNGDGNWINDVKGVRRVLYRLPELLAGGEGPVYIPEGEKHVDALRALGLRATTNPGGAGKWRPEYASHFKGADVVVLPDCDKVGRDHAKTIASSLRGVASSVRVLALPGLSEKGDVLDWIAAGGTSDELVKLADALTEAEPESPIEIMWPGEYAEPEMQWCIKHRLPEVGEGLMSGAWGTIKTFTLLDIFWALAKEKKWTGQKIARPGGSFLFAPERPYDIPLRLRGRGIYKTVPFGWAKSCPPLLTPKGTMCEQSVEQIIATLRVAQRHMARLWEVELVSTGIDTISRAAQFPSGGENDSSTSAAVMTALAVISAELRIFVLGTDHMGKDPTKGTRGSSSKEQWAGTVFHMFGKNGNGRLKLEKISSGAAGISIPYTLREVTLGRDRDGDPVTTCIVEWGEPGEVADVEEPTSKAGQLLRQIITGLGGLPVSRDEARGIFCERWNAKTPEAKRMAFGRAINNLGLVDIRGQLQDPVQEEFPL